MRRVMGIILNGILCGFVMWLFYELTITIRVMVYLAQSH